MGQWKTDQIQVRGPLLPFFLLLYHLQLPCVSLGSRGQSGKRFKIQYPNTIGSFVVPGFSDGEVAA